MEYKIRLIAEKNLSTQGSKASSLFVGVKVIIEVIALATASNIPIIIAEFFTI